MEELDRMTLLQAEIMCEALDSWQEAGRKAEDQ